MVDNLESAICITATDGEILAMQPIIRTEDIEVHRSSPWRSSAFDINGKHNVVVIG